MEHQIQDGKRALKLNLGETVVRFFYKGQAGLTIIRGRERRRAVSEFAQRAVVAEQKKSAMLVCILCDDATLQPNLPQLVLANEHTLRVQGMAELNSVQVNVHVKRRNSAWVNVPDLVEYVNLFGNALLTDALER